MSVTADLPQDNPGVIAPPPLIALLAVVFGGLLNWLLPTNLLASVLPYWPKLIVGALLALVGIAIAMAGRMRFVALGTNVQPWKPALKLATTGIYTRVRNPMYVGLILLVFGIGIALASDWIVLMAVATAFVLHFGVVLREERYLARKFGDEYRSYMASVPRWGLF